MSESDEFSRFRQNDINWKKRYASLNSDATLVCPAMFDLGEAKKVVIVSTTEGDDKPLKYPHIFLEADICVINKIDLAPYLDTDVETCGIMP